MRGGTMEVKAQLLRELLTESNAFGYLLAGAGPGGEAGGRCPGAPHASGKRCSPVVTGEAGL
jgi:hypothetical protein